MGILFNILSFSLYCPFIIFDGEDSYIIIHHQSPEGVIGVPADTARDENTSYSKLKMFYSHMHLEALFNSGIKFKYGWAIHS